MGLLFVNYSAATTDVFKFTKTIQSDFGVVVFDHGCPPNSHKQGLRMKVRRPWSVCSSRLNPSDSLPARKNNLTAQVWIPGTVYSIDINSTSAILAPWHALQEL
jgi:hypothetical protein